MATSAPIPAASALPSKRAPRKSAAMYDGLEPKRSAKEVNWALKKADSEPLLRNDIQWEVLNLIFNDRTFNFTAPVDQTAPPGEPIYLNFDQLYLESILSSMKTTQNLRAKLIEQPTFAIAFCKMCLLINIGRINTTLAFYPQMKTALRTYHPVPSLQADESSRRDMQDAPRIKGILKACYLDWEVSEQPASLRDIAVKRASPTLTRGPPTTVVTLIFHMMAEAGWVTEKYFPAGFDLLDLFYPSEMPAAPRAQAFLSLVHHFLENRAFLNDFSLPPSASPIPLRIPLALQRTPPPGAPRENVDTEEELEYAREMKEIRSGVVKTVPAYQKREEEEKRKEAERVGREGEGGGIGGEGAGGGGAVGPTKGPGQGVGGGRKRKVEGTGGRSFAKVTREMEASHSVVEILPAGWEEEDWNDPRPKKSALPFTWQKIKRDLRENRDPDYESDEDDAQPYDLLLRRSLLTVVDPTAPSSGRRVPVTEVMEYGEWLRRKEQGFVEPPAGGGGGGGGGGGEEDEIQYPGDEMEGGSDGDD